MSFQNRCEAGQRLAAALTPYQKENPLIFALPRGGVPVAYEVAKALKAPLYVYVVRKIGLPWNPELGVGAIAPGIEILDEVTLRATELTPSALKDEIEHEKEELTRRMKAYGAHEDLSSLVEGKVVIVVDDGLATGISAGVALQGLRTFNPAKLILAVPVGSPEVIAKLKAYADEVICLETPRNFYAVGAFYADFSQTTDEEVISLLNKGLSRKRPENG